MSAEFVNRMKDLRYPYPISLDTMCLQNLRINDKYVIFDLIGVGSHSSIYYGIEQATGVQRAFKFYNFKEIQKQNSFAEKEFCKRFSNYQFQIMKICGSKSSNIVKCIEIIESRDHKILVMQYCNMGTLLEEIQRRKSKQINEEKAIMILISIIAAVKCLHQQTGRLHKNLKSKNILIKNGIYKLVDFGLPVSYESAEQSIESQFMIPQIILKKKFDQKAEVWNIGIIFHQILFGKIPEALIYSSKAVLMSPSVRSIFKNTENRYSSAVNDFLQRCLMTDPNQRMSWKELQSHKLFFQINHFQNYSKKSQNQNSRLSTILFPLENQLYPDLSEIQQKKIQKSKSVYLENFVLEIEKKQIQKDLQKPYERLGQILQISRMEPVQWKTLRQKASKAEEERYKQLISFYVQCLKTDFFFNQVFLVIKKVSQSNDNRKLIEFLFLIVSRCFFQISQINSLKIGGDPLQHLFVIVKKQTNTLYDKVSSNWYEFSEKLEKQENKWFNIISDRFKKTLNSLDYENKEKFITGIQGKDYQRDEQINFTIEFYRKQSIQQLINNYLTQLTGNQKIKEQIKQAISYLQIYEKIWNLKIIQDSYSSLKEYVNQELFHQRF